MAWPLILAAGLACAEPMQAPRTTTEVLQAWDRELCGAVRSSSGVDSGISDELDRAQNLMSEGRLEEVEAILCEQLAARVATFGVVSPRAVSVFNSFAVLLRKQGQVARSRRLLEDLLSVVEPYPPEGRFLKRAVLNNLGTALYAQGYMAESQAVFERTLALARESGDASSQSMGATLTNLAFAIEGQGRYSEAEAYHRKALELRSAEGGPSVLEMAASLNNLGANLTAQKRFEEGEPLLMESLRIRESVLGEANLNVGFSLGNLAVNALEQGRLDSATRYASRLVKLREKALGAEHPETALAYQLLANARFANKDYPAALRFARAALASRIPYTLRESAAVSDDVRANIRAESAPVALVVVRSAWELSRGQPKSWSAGAVPPLVNEAFAAAQRIPVSTTADAFSRAASRSEASDSSLRALAIEYAKTEGARAAADRSLTQVIANAEPVDALRAKRAELDSRLANLERELAARFPSFLDFARPKPVDVVHLAAASNAIGNDDALVLLTPGSEGSRGIVWVVTRGGGGAWAELGLDASALTAAVSSLRLELDLAAAYNATTPINGPSADFDRAKANALYRALFGAAEVSSILEHKRHWILVPQGPLLALPFAALVTDLGSVDPSASVADRLRATSWLGLTHTTSIMPSPAALTLRSHEVHAGRRGHFFGVGDPAFKGRADDKPGPIEQYVGDRGARIDKVEDLPALPGTRIEIENIASLLKAKRTDYLLAEEASETELLKPLRQKQLAGAKTVAFATHGLVSGDLASLPDAEPALALSPPPRSTASDDGLWTASEVAQSTLNADLVLLSACRTAAGDRLGGEGLTGLARAFFAAGARNLLVSHWRVRDDVAARLTVRTVELMTSPHARHSAAEALQIAMTELVDDRSSDRTAISRAHPAIWAAFEVVGAR